MQVRADNQQLATVGALTRIWCKQHLSGLNQAARLVRCAPRVPIDDVTLSFPLAAPRFLGLYYLLCIVLYRRPVPERMRRRIGGQLCRLPRWQLQLVVRQVL
jgi:hypothetical protein